jgi:hypothetical protein
VLGGLQQEQPLQVPQPFGVFGGDVAGLGPVLRGVQLPDVIVQRRELLLLTPGGRVAGYGGPALVVDAAVDKDLEVLRLVLLGGGGIVEGVQHAHPLERRLLDPVHEGRVLQMGSLQDGGGDVDDVRELGAQLALCPDPGRPVDDQPVPGAAPVEATCLVHWYGVSIACAQPTA